MTHPANLGIRERNAARWQRHVLEYRSTRVRQLNREIVNFGTTGPMGMRVPAPDF
jgi:hypothetical protein